ncbi:MAG: acylneuraminate cytidylyltransferase family protein, partial [Opitutales bacterium]|nr:acylneuraminate cytidylyltransferase family protein [Opitutales bacterium]
MKTFALLPLRGGSKSIPRKNLKPLAGRPLFHWTALAACAAEGIDEVHIATDDAEIADSARALGHPKIRIFERSAATATDTASTESVMLEFAEQVDFNRLVLIQATSPLLRAEELDGGLAKLLEAGADSLLSVVRQKRFFWREGATGVAVPVNYDPANRPRRQDFDGQFVENGAFYVSSRSGLLQSRCRLHGRIAVYEMPEETYVELDEPVDWAFVERLMRQRSEVGDHPSSIIHHPSPITHHPSPITHHPS